MQKRFSLQYHILPLRQTGSKLDALCTSVPRPSLLLSYAAVRTQHRDTLLSSRKLKKTRNKPKQSKDCADRGEICSKCQKTFIVGENYWWNVIVRALNVVIRTLFVIDSPNLCYSTRRMSTVLFKIYISSCDAFMIAVASAVEHLALKSPHE